MTERGIYIASKTKYAYWWRRLRDNGLPVVSTWIDEAGEGETASFQDLWQRCIEEVTSAACVILYAEPDDVLKGAFIEVGAALATGIPVYVVGRQPRWSWTAHPLATECKSIDDAIGKAMRVFGAAEVTR